MVVVLVVVGAFLVFFLVVSPAVSATITPQIYSVPSNYGYLNEEANFSFQISNLENNQQQAQIVVLSESSVVTNQSVSVSPGSTTTRLISVRLDSLALWKAEATINGTVLDSYSFQVLTNRAEADIAINQWNDLQFHNNLDTATIVVAVVALLVSIIAYLKPRSKST
jgi:hypothetical protein